MEKFINRGKKEKFNTAKKIESFLLNKETENYIQEQLSEQKRQDDLYKRNLNIKAQNYKPLEEAKRKRINEIVDINTNAILNTLFSSLIFKSYPGKAGDISGLKKHLVNKSRIFFNESLNNGVIDFNNSPIFKNAYYSAHAYALNSKAVLNPKECIKGAKEVYKHNKLELNYLTDIVKGKVSDSLIKESKLVDVRKNINENLHDGFKKENKSLFRNLHETAIKDILKDEESINESVSESDINLKGLQEAILNYTILEMLHTSKLANFDLSKINSNNKLIFKK